MKGVDLEGLAQRVIFDQGELGVPRIKETSLFREDIFGQKQPNLGKEKHLNMKGKKQSLTISAPITLFQIAYRTRKITCGNVPKTKT